MIFANDATFVGDSALDACSGFVFIVMAFGVIIVILAVIETIVNAFSKKGKDGK